MFGGELARRLVVSQGDPEGVGPDLLLWAASRSLWQDGDRVVACPQVLESRASRLNTDWARKGLSVLRTRLDDQWQGPSQFSSLQRAVDLVLAEPHPHRVALLTPPIDKAVAAKEGLPTPGHTEYLALRANAQEVAMFMAGPKLRVTLATVHMALREVPDALDAGIIARRTALLVQALRSMYGIAKPKIALLSLNPHAGEGGQFGSEEQNLLNGLVHTLASEHAPEAEILGPLPADTAFALHAQGELDGLVAMYHDQGLAPFKLLHFHDGVNVTLGLPFVRTSPDHGTAKDIAGTSRVDPRSFLSALCLARGDRDEMQAWINQGA